MAALYDDGEDPTRANELRRQINAAKADNDLNLAFKLSQAAEAELPKSWEFTFGKAQVLRSMQCFLDAQPILERLHKKHPSQSRVAVALADTSRILGDVPRAEELLATVTPKKHAHVDAKLGQLRILKAQGNAQQALVHGEATLNTTPGNLRIVREHADTMVHMYQYGAAAHLLDQHLAASEHEDGLFLARADVAMLSGQLSLAGRILTHCPNDLETLRRYRRLDELQMAGTARSDALIGTQSLMASIDGPAETISVAKQIKLADLRFLMEDWRGALRHYRLSGCNKSRNRMRTMRIATCHFRLLEFTACRNALQRVLTQSPLSQEALSLLAQLNMIEGHTNDSLAATRQLFDMGGHRQAAHGVRLYKSLMRLENAKDAQAVMDQMIAAAHNRFEPDLVNCLLQFGATKKAYDICAFWVETANCNTEYARLIAAVGDAYGTPFEGLQVPPTEPTTQRAIDLAEMRKLGTTDTRAAHHLPVSNALLTAWKVADQSQMPFEAWQSLVRRATQNSGQMSHHTTPAAEIEGFTDFPKVETLGDYANPEIPIIITGTHFGPLVSSALQDNLLKGRKTVYLRTQELDGLNEKLLITTNTNPKAAAIMLVKALRDGKTVSSAVDAPIFWQSNGQINAGARGEIFGVPITISSTPVKLALAFNAPIFWIQPLWKGGRIHFEVAQMAQPDPDVPFQDAADAWAAQYLKRVESVMQSGPENQNLNAPMWQHLLHHGVAAHPCGA